MTIKYKFKEDQKLREITEYVNKTYTQHYAQDEKIQAFEAICQKGWDRGLNFAIDNALKYTWRQGFKPGQERSDILKIIHYGIMALYAYDEKEVRQKKSTEQFYNEPNTGIPKKPFKTLPVVNNSPIMTGVLAECNPSYKIGSLTVHGNGVVSIENDLYVKGDVIANAHN